MSLHGRDGGQLLRPVLVTRKRKARQLMKRADLITGIVLLVLSGYVIQEAWQMPPSATFAPGSGFLPSGSG